MSDRGIVAVILASTLLLSILASIGALTYRNRTLGQVGGDVMIAILGAIVGALSTYIGTEIATP